MGSLFRATFSFIRNGIALMLVLTALSGNAYGGGWPSQGPIHVGDSKDAASAPEIDSGTLASAMVLLAGGALMLTSRRRQE